MHLDFLSLLLLGPLSWLSTSFPFSRKPALLVQTRGAALCPCHQPDGTLQAAGMLIGHLGKSVGGKVTNDRIPYRTARLLRHLWPFLSFASSFHTEHSIKCHEQLKFSCSVGPLSQAPGVRAEADLIGTNKKKGPECPLPAQRDLEPPWQLPVQENQGEEETCCCRQSCADHLPPQKSLQPGSHPSTYPTSQAPAQQELLHSLPQRSLTPQFTLIESQSSATGRPR